MAARLEYTETDIDAHHGRKRLIRWMMAEGFLWDGFYCDHCGTVMQLQRSSHAELDGFCWRCPAEGCKHRKSIREGSFFAFSQLSLRAQMKLFINFVAQSSARSTGLRTRIDRKSVGNFYMKMMKAIGELLLGTQLGSLLALSTS